MNKNLPPLQDAKVIDMTIYQTLIPRASREPTGPEDAALRRLLEIGRADTGQSRRVADFLLAWWNAGSCGGFDPTNLWGVDEPIAADMVTVFGLIARVNKYPDTLGYETEFKAVVRAWRPELQD